MKNHAQGKRLRFTHSRPQRPRSFWSAPTIATSGRRVFVSPIRFVRFYRSVKCGLPVLNQLRDRNQKERGLWERECVTRSLHLIFNLKLCLVVLFGSSRNPFLRPWTKHAFNKHSNIFMALLSQRAHGSSRLPSTIKRVMFVRIQQQTSLSWRFTEAFPWPAVHDTVEKALHGSCQTLSTDTHRK